MRKPHHHEIGWALFGVLAFILIWWLTRAKAVLGATTQVFVSGTAGLPNASNEVGGIWDSHADQHAPNYATGIPAAVPFQSQDGTLQCIAGWSLWKDSATGVYACYKDPSQRFVN